MKLISSVVALTLAASSGAALAQDDAPGRQYASLSQFKWNLSTPAALDATVTIDDSVDPIIIDSISGSYADTGRNLDAQGWRLLTGYRVTDWLGVELQVGTGGKRGFAFQGLDFTATFPPGFTEDDLLGLDLDALNSIEDLEDLGVTVDVTDQSGAGQVKLNQIWSLMLRPAWEPNDLFSLYALVGYSYAKVDYRTPPSWYTVSERGLSYGVGAEVGIFPSVFNGGLRVHVDYVRYLDESAIELDALSFGVGLRF